MNTIAKYQLALALAATALLPVSAMAFPAAGTNGTLDANGGTLYIPLQPATSGMLGDGGTVGLVADSVSLTGTGTTSSGMVYFLLTFDISGELGQGLVVDPNSAVMLLNFRDLDFMTVTATNRYNYKESLQVSFVQNASDPMPGSPDITLNNLNYGLYREDGFGPTNNVEALYELNMKLDLGVTDAEFANISSDGEFGLWIGMGANITHLRNTRDTVLNTSELIDNNDFLFVGVPEPTTIGLLALGGVGVLLRKNRR